MADTAVGCRRRAHPPRRAIRGQGADGRGGRARGAGDGAGPEGRDES